MYVTSPFPPTLPPPGCCCCQIFSRGIRESPEDVSFLCHSLGSLELAAKRPAEAMDVFVAGIERYRCSLALPGGG